MSGGGFQAVAFTKSGGLDAGGGMTIGDLVVFGLATVVLLAVFVSIELLVRRAGWNSEATRRIAHVTACLYGVATYLVTPVWFYVPAALGFAGLMLLSRRFHVFTSVHKTRRRSLGDVYLPLGLAIAAVVAEFAAGDPAPVFVAATLVLGFGDVAAGVSGDLRGAERKTWLGTLVFAVVAALVVAFTGFGLLPVLLVAVLGAFAERYSSLGTDNLTIPAVTAGILAFF